MAPLPPPWLRLCSAMLQLLQFRLFMRQDTGTARWKFGCEWRACVTIQRLVTHQYASSSNGLCLRGNQSPAGCWVCWCRPGSQLATHLSTHCQELGELHHVLFVSSLDEGLLGQWWSAVCSREHKELFIAGPCMGCPLQGYAWDLHCGAMHGGLHCGAMHGVSIVGHAWGLHCDAKLCQVPLDLQERRTFNDIAQNGYAWLVSTQGLPNEKSDRLTGWLERINEEMKKLMDIRWLPQFGHGQDEVTMVAIPTFVSL